MESQLPAELTAVLTGWKSLLCLTHTLGWLKTQEATRTVQKSWWLLFWNWDNLAIRCLPDLSNNFSSSAIAQTHWFAWSQRGSSEMVLLHFPQALTTCSKHTILEGSLKNPQSIKSNLQPDSLHGKSDKCSNIPFSRSHHSGKTVTP